MAKPPTDFILIFLSINDQKFGQHLKTYSSNLEKLGLTLETVTSETLKGREFIKVQVPLEVAISLAHTYRIGLACKNPYHDYENVTVPFFRFLDSELTTTNPSLVLASRNRESVKGQPKYPTTAERIMIVYEALRAAKFGDQSYAFGVEEMKRKGILEAAYPIHDGQWQWTTTGPLNDRQLLNTYWSNLWVICKLQPTKLIQKYLGPEAGFYYAMLELYMTMLAPVVIFGFISYLVHSFRDDPRLRQICKSQTTMCPNCKSPKSCNFNSLSSACKYSRLNYIFDNDSAMPYSVVMSFWGVIFLSLWERKQSFLQVAWNIPRYLRSYIASGPSYYQASEEPHKPRNKLNRSSSFWANVKLSLANTYENLQNWGCSKSKQRKTERLVKVTNPSKEYSADIDGIPYLTNAQRFAPFKYFLIGVIVVGVVDFLTLVCIISCRIAITQNLAVWKPELSPEGEPINTTGIAMVFTANITAILGIVIIIAYDFAAGYLAFWLTDFENPTTQTGFDRSYTIKLVAFCFINNFTIPIYLALFRGINYTYPGDNNMWSFFLGINADICDVSGCFADVWIFIAMLIPIKSFVYFCKNVLYPVLYKELMDTPRLFTNMEHSQWEIDRDLTPLPQYYITNLQKEFVIQYGFIVFFASSYSLLPLIVLVVNILELRIYAMMITRFYQRPVPRQSCERDIWRKILLIITTIAIFINVRLCRVHQTLLFNNSYLSIWALKYFNTQACILGTTLNWPDRQYFKKYVNRKLEGYINSLISNFSVEDYGVDSKIKECYYVGRKVTIRSEANSTNYQFSDLYFPTHCAKYLFTIWLMVTVIIVGLIFRYVTSASHNLREKAFYQQKLHSK